MKREEVDGATIYTDLATDENGWTWNVTKRTDGSISLYATQPGIYGHAVIYDSLDGTVTLRAREIINQLCEAMEPLRLLERIVSSKEAA